MIRTLGLIDDEINKTVRNLSALHGDTTPHGTCATVASRLIFPVNSHKGASPSAHSIPLGSLCAHCIRTWDFVPITRHKVVAN